MKDWEYREILRRMIDNELQAMTFYLNAAEHLEDPAARFHFETLADEEREHASSFYNLYPGTDIPPFEALVRARLLQGQPEVKEQVTGLNERQALRLALEMELQVEAKLRHLLDEFHSDQALEVIRSNVESTLSHAMLIAEDIERLGEETNQEGTG